MITAKYGKPVKLESIQSVYLLFPYNIKIVEVIRRIQNRYYNALKKEWEIDASKLKWLQEELPNIEFKIVGKEKKPRNKKVKAVKEVLAEMPSEIKTKLYDYQVDGFNYGMTHAKFLLADQPGLGKSLQMIAVALARQQEFKHCLIICGIGSLMWNWYNEIKEHTGIKSTVLGSRKNRKGIWNIKGNKDKLDDLKVADKYFLITNVDTLQNKPLVEQLKKMIDKDIIGMVIFDEIHKLSSPTSLSARALLRLSPMYAVPLTGTPLMNSPLSLYLILKWVGAETGNFGDFKREYADWGGYGGHSVIRYKNMDLLQKKLDSVQLRRLKAKVLNLPPRIDKTEYVEMTGPQKKLYSDVMDEVMANIDKIELNPNPLTMLIRLRQVTADTSILSSTIKEAPKFDRAEEIIEELVQNGEKVIVVSNWTTVTDIAERRFKRWNPAVITGKVKNRMEQKERFMTDPKCKVLIGTLKAMGVGLTLTVASTIIFLDLPYTYAEYDQCADRIHRIGTKSTCYIISLVCRNSIDERIQELVLKKKYMSDTIVDKIHDVNNKEVVKYLLS